MSEKRIKLEYEYNSGAMEIYRWENGEWQQVDDLFGPLSVYTETPLDDMVWDKDFFFALADAAHAGKRDIVHIYFSEDGFVDGNKEDVYDTLQACLNACDKIRDDFTLEKITESTDIDGKDARDAMGIIFGKLAESFGMRVQFPKDGLEAAVLMPGSGQGLSAQQIKQRDHVRARIRYFRNSCNSRFFRNSQRGSQNTITELMGEMIQHLIDHCYDDFGYSSAERFEAALCKAWGCRPDRWESSEATASGTAVGAVLAEAAPRRGSLKSTELDRWQSST